MRGRGLLVATALLAVAAVDGARAHEVRPGHLELSQAGVETFDVTWKVRTAVSRTGFSQPSWAWRLPAYGIGSMATFWMIERLAGFWL